MEIHEVVNTFIKNINRPLAGDEGTIDFKDDPIYKCIGKVKIFRVMDLPDGLLLAFTEKRVPVVFHPNSPANSPGLYGVLPVYIYLQCVIEIGTEKNIDLTLFLLAQAILYKYRYRDIINDDFTEEFNSDDEEIMSQLEERINAFITYSVDDLKEINFFVIRDTDSLLIREMNTSLMN